MLVVCVWVLMTWLKDESRMTNNGSNPKLKMQTRTRDLFRLVIRACLEFRNSGFELLRPGPREHHGHGTPEDFQVQPERPIVDVLEIEADPIPEVRNILPATDLPETTEPRFDT